MKVIPWGKHLVQLQRFGPLFPMNAYLVREDDGFTLIDTMMLAGSAAKIIDTAKALGAPIRRIALTHPHGDHAGSLAALHAALPDAEVLIGARDLRIVKGDRSLDRAEAQVPIKGGWPTLTTSATCELRGGDHVGSLEVVATPGHTPGSLSFSDLRDGSVIVGDALQTQGGLAVAGVVRWLFPLPAMATWDKLTAAVSAARLLALQPTRIAPGHGPVLEHPLEALSEAVTEASRKAVSNAHSGTA